MTETPVQLLMYRFGPDAGFEGRLIGALERMESGGALRVLEALFVGKVGASGELSALVLHSRGAGSMVSPLVGFRLDASERAKATATALASEDLGPLLRELADRLGPGEALAAVLVEHIWARALDAAVSSSGGIPLTGAYVEASSLSELGPLLVAEADSS